MRSSDYYMYVGLTQLNWGIRILPLAEKFPGMAQLVNIVYTLFLPVFLLARGNGSAKQLQPFTNNEIMRLGGWLMINDTSTRGSAV